MTRDVDCLVLGLGGFGSGALYWLSQRPGLRVLGLEQFELGHVRGASQDHSRIIRLSYHTPAYVELAKHAYRAWAHVEDEARERLILRTGGLDLGRPGCAIRLEDYARSMTAAGVAFERLDAGEIMRRFPAFELASDMYGFYQAESGIVMAARCNAAHQRLAREHGATIVERATVSDIHVGDGEVDVATTGDTFRCGRLIVTAGAWSNRLLRHFDLTLPLTVTQEQVTYFEAREPERFLPDRFPIWIWFDEPSFYGFPTFGENGPKVAQDVGGREVTADSRTFEPDPEALARVEEFLSRHLPSALGPIIYTKTCLYTLTPDRDFVVDTLPDHPNVAVAIGAGHGFKFASLVGRALSELVMDGTASVDLDPFRIDRPILKEANPATRFLI